MSIPEISHNSSRLSLFKGARKVATASSLAKQVKLLKECINSGIDLDSALQAQGLTYDNLRYEYDEPLKKAKHSYRTLSDFQVRPHGIPIVSFFAGAGGADLGFEAAGFEHTALVEVNRLFCDTLRLNRPKWRIIGPPEHPGDVSQIDSISCEIRRAIGSAKRFDGVFVGGPPCQPFSIAANQRFSKSGNNFKRIGYAHKTNGNLLFDFISLVKQFRPAAFLIENVAGLADVDDGVQLKEALKTLTDSGYQVEKPQILNAANYQVPQQRHRMFIVGNRIGKDFKMALPCMEVIPSSSVFTLPTNGLENHETRKHKAESILRYIKLEYGQRDQLGRVDRLNPYLPSKTVIAGGTAGGGRSHLHPTIPRTLSVREGARLQTFPDNYVFTGPAARQFTQVGNAVPPVLAAQIATALRKSVFP